jgi:hypothetical protein
VVAADECQPADEEVDQLAVQQYEDTDALRSAWRTASEAASENAQADEVCSNETPGTSKWGFGNVICETVDGVARVRWTDSRTDTMGVVESSGTNVEALYEWWRTNARPLGRGAEATDSETSESKESSEPTPKPRKLVRVPGKPGNATCTASTSPIPDEWDRTWRITRVNFKNENGYERVVLHMERTGKNRTNTPTQTAVSRMSVNKLKDAVPKAPTPGRGKVAIVLDIDGIDDAPSLYNFQPSGLDYVKQMSIVKTNGSWTVVISSPLGTCNQVRIPIWSSAATGKEDKAEIYIDLKPRNT